MIFQGQLSPFAQALVLAVLCGAQAVDAEEPHWEEHPHHISLLVAGTDDDEETAFTLGVDYEYRVSEFLGLGAVLEYATEDIDATTALVVADLHIWRGLAIQTGPGVERIDGDDGNSDETEAIYRIGALYELEVGRYTVSPQIHYDFSSGEDAVVFGLAFGFSF